VLDNTPCTTGNSSRLSSQWLVIFCSLYQYLSSSVSDRWWDLLDFIHWGRIRCGRYLASLSPASRGAWTIAVRNTSTKAMAWCGDRGCFAVTIKCYMSRLFYYMGSGG